MMPSRFILNTDYATFKNDAEGTGTLTVPNSIVMLPNQGDTIITTTIDIGASASAAYRTYIESSKYSHVMMSSTVSLPCTESMPGYGSWDSTIPVTIYRSNKKFVVELRAPEYAPDPAEPNPPANVTYSGMGQTLTIHIQSFIDPFQA